MRIHRFIGEFDLDAERLVSRDAAFRNQLKNVLRLAPGDGLRLCDGKGREASARILGFGPADVELVIEAVEANGSESAVRVTLYCAVLKRENFELAAQKATEAGAAAIVPVITRRTVKFGLRADRIRTIMKEAAEQSGRGVIPALAEAMDLAAALDHAAANDANVVFELGGAAFDPRSCAPERRGTVGAFIGPEGGWEPEEVDAARSRGYAIASLCKRTLRAETAAIVATHALASWGDGARD